MSNVETDTETKNEKFKRLANARTAEVLDILRKIGNLSNTANYQFTKEQVDLVFNAIQSKLDQIHDKFNEKLEK